MKVEVEKIWHYALETEVMAATEVPGISAYQVCS